ncbi:hypothetical protein [Vitiosangium sp. GDMCC 1.1324]|uniref:hypothetical protein n=1 Tax=Vitiosangium sp. (strain GDMCC 1.1324) TaxID=2138576 RepID=UPI000D3677DD|nr:hypothetical protein [Vitiosangium sp. GDMCC 1.1324]PTL79693.1 hypothetical protein DAT35_33365 [Vitiosangium sp. GDMCC 1.1324]
MALPTPPFPTPTDGAAEARPAARSLVLTLLTWVGWGLVLLGAGALARVMARQLFLDGDTEDLLRCADGVRACLSAGRWSGCSEAGQWPLLQFGPALLVRLAGGSREDAGLALCYLSLAAFFGLLVMTWWTLAARSRPVAVAAVLVLASGLLFHYATRSFGEMVASFVTAAFAAAWLRRRGPWLVALLAFVTGLTKETAFPFIALLGATCAVVHRAPGMTWRELLRAERGRLVGSAAAVVLSGVLSAGFNLFRFGTPYNVAYLDAASLVPPASVQVEHFAALWVAPNAGLLFFWPFLVVLLAALPVAVARQGERGGGRPSWFPVLGMAALVGMFCLLLSRWCAPFGWWAWGSRLVLPWLPAALLVLLYAYAGAAESLVCPLVATPVRTALLALALMVASVPHLVSIYRSNELLGALFVDRGICPGFDRPEYADELWRCYHAQAWEYPSALLHAYRLAPGSEMPKRAWLYPALLALGCVWLRRSARGGEKPAQSNL